MRKVKLTIGKTLGDKATILCSPQQAAVFAAAFARVTMGAEGTDFKLNKTCTGVGLTDSSRTDFYVRVETLSVWGDNNA